MRDTRSAAVGNVLESLQLGSLDMTPFEDRSVEGAGGGAYGPTRIRAKWDVYQRANASLHSKNLADLGSELLEKKCQRLILIGLISEKRRALSGDIQHVSCSCSWPLNLVVTTVQTSGSISHKRPPELMERLLDIHVSRRVHGKHGCAANFPKPEACKSGMSWSM